MLRQHNAILEKKIAAKQAANAAYQREADKKDMERLCAAYSPTDKRRREAEAFLLEEAERTLARVRSGRGRYPHTMPSPV